MEDGAWGVQGLGFRALGLGFRVFGLGVQGFLRVEDLGFGGLAAQNPGLRPDLFVRLTPATRCFDRIRRIPNP